MVERLVANEKVEGSTPFARSNYCKTLNYITSIFQRYIENKDIRSFKKNIFYYLIFRIFRKFFNHDIIVKIFNFKILASYKKNKTSNALLRKCGFDDKMELNTIRQISNNNDLFFLDCGSNYGFYSFFTAALKKDNIIIAIEASKNTCEVFKKNLGLNQFKNIHLINCAISNSNDEQIEFLESENDWESSLSHENFRLKYKSKIFTKKIDTILSNKNLDNKILLIKLDIEGNEFKALAGADSTIKDFSPIIIIEISRFIFNQNDAKSYFSNFLKKYDYKVYDNKKNELSYDKVFNLIENLDSSHNTIGNYFLIKNKSINEKLFLKNG